MERRGRARSRVAMFAACGIAAAMLMCASSAASAQQPPSSPPPSSQPPPPSGPPGQGQAGQGQAGQGQAGAQGPGAQTGNATVFQRAAGPLWLKTHALLQVGGFGNNPDNQVVELLRLGGAPTNFDRNAITNLRQGDRDSARELALLPQDNLSADVRTAMSALSSSDAQATENGQAISIPPIVFVRALRDLVLNEGAAGSPDPPFDFAAMARVLAQVIGQPPTGPGGPASTQPTSPVTTAAAASTTVVNAAPAVTTAPVTEAAPTRGTAFGLIIGGAVGLAIALIAVGLFVNNRRRQGSEDRVRTLDSILDVSRRLTAAAATGSIAAPVVREALTLVPATAGALVRRSGASLELSYESQDGLVIPDRLTDGALGRVAETGQIVTQVSATEPAISNLPVALIAVPVVGGGRVEAVLVLVRDAAQPFDNDDRESLGAMAPVVAAAMQAADQAEVMAEAGAIDPLTGVANRRTLDKELDEQLTNAGDEPTSLVMVDIDHFKRVNDNFGHPAGDEVLKGIAAVLRDTVRPDDRVYRYGGEEFCVILPRTSPDEAAMVAERLREAVRGASFDIGDDEPYRASASFGVATTSSSTPGELVAQADKALYDAKRDGRDRVVVASPA